MDSISFTAPFLIYTTHLDKAHTKDQKYNPLGNLTFLSETAAFRCCFQLLALLSPKFPNSQKSKNYEKPEI